MDHHHQEPNPFEDSSFIDPLCELHLKETSDFVQSLPPLKNNNMMSEVSSVHTRRKRRDVRVEAPPTPGRPIFGFSPAKSSVSRKGFPSKWDDAEKWLNSNGGTGSCHESPAHHHLALLNLNHHPLTSNHKQDDNISERSRVVQENVDLDHHQATNELLTDKFTCEVEVEKEGFFFGNIVETPMRDASTEMVQQDKHRDIGTEMTPLGSSTTSRCQTPIKTASPARHNTPATRSGPLSLSSSPYTIDMSQLHDCHLAKLQFDSVVSTWSSREEEEEEISKSLRHFEFRKSVSETARLDFHSPSPWEEDEKNKACLRYQREEAKIQAWVNLQNAKAEARSRKLEVKIQKMRSEMEEKLMKRMAFVHKRAEEWRASAVAQHSEQIQKVNKNAQKKMHHDHDHDHGSIKKNYHHHHNNKIGSAGSCGCCFPCSTSGSMYHH